MPSSLVDDEEGGVDEAQDEAGPGHAVGSNPGARQTPSDGVPEAIYSIFEEFINHQ